MVFQSIASVVRRRAALMLLSGGVSLVVAPRAEAQQWGINGVNVFIPPVQLFTLYAVNNAGQAVGTARAGGSVIFSTTDGITTLGGLPGALNTTFTSINNSGQVAGDAILGGGQVTAVTLSPGGSTEALSAPTSASGVLINDRGQVAGITASAPQSVVVWNGGLASVLNLSASHVSGMNNAGQIVGASGPGQGVATLWDGTTAKNLSVGGTSSRAADINDPGVVVGYRIVTEIQPNGGSAGVAHAFAWPNGATELLAEFAGGSGSRAIGISDDGMIVGLASNPAAAADGAIWESIAGTYHVFNLSDIVNTGANSGWEIQQATAVSDNGEYIVATARNAALGYSGAVVLQQNVVTATPEPASLVLMATGLVGVAGVARRRKRGRAFDHSVSISTYNT